MALVVRQGIEFTATGAEKVAKDAAKVTSSVKEAGKAGESAGGGMRRLEGAFDGLTEPAGKVLGKLGQLGDVFKLTATFLAGGALFGGLQDIADSLRLLAEKSGFAEFSLRRMADAGFVLTQEDVFGAKHIKNAAAELDIYVESLGKANKAMLTWKENQRFLQDVATGKIQTLDSIRFELAKVANQLATLKARGAEAEGIDIPLLAGSAPRGVTPKSVQNVGATAIARQKELEQEFARLQDLEARAMAPAVFNAMARDADASNRKAADRAKATASMAPRKAQDAKAWLDDYFSTPVDDAEYDSMVQGNTTKALDAWKKAQTPGAPPSGGGSNIPGPRGAMPDEIPQYAKPEILTAYTESGKSALQGLAQTSMDVGGIIAGSLGTITSTFGAAMTNLVLAGDTGSQGIKKSIGNALAALSAQAFGYSLLLGALAAASALVPILGLPAAGALGAGAAIMAVAGVALGLTARAMGADKLGQKPSAAKSGGNATSAPRGSLAGPGMGDGQPLQVHLYLDGNPVYDSMLKVEQNRRRSGSMSMPRLGVAT